MRKFIKNVALYVLVITIVVTVFNTFLNPQSKRSEITYSSFVTQVNNKNVESVIMTEESVVGKLKDGTEFATYLPNDTGTLLNKLTDNGVSVTVRPPEQPSWWMGLLSSVLPILILVGVWFWIMNQTQGGGGRVMNFGKSKAKMTDEGRVKVTFKDVAGEDEAKENLTEIVDYLHDPSKYKDIGASMPKGILLVGPPGTGKTMLAKAVAGEANVPFFSMSGSEFVEMFVGMGASKVRDLFKQAKEKAPCIVFIDEIDAIGKKRDGQIGGNDEREQTLNQLLTEMDGFEGNSGVMILAATNRPDALDPALTRPGRFDRQVLVDKPDFKGRIEILRVHIKDIKLDHSVSIEDIARMTAGLAGADLANIINEAALLAGRKEKGKVEQADLLEAVERAIAGLEKKSRRINPKEKRIVAYHESGHALIAETTKGANRVTKVSIIPRGLAALGYTLHTPEENKFMMQRHELMAEVDVLLAGRAAEEVFIKEISTGAGNDLERATDILRSMISIYGMSDIAGLMVLEKRRSTFLAGGQADRDYSDKTAEKVDEFIKTTLDERYKHVLETLRTYGDAIEKMVEALYEEETIEGAKVREIIANYEQERGMPSRLVNLEENKEEQA
ncbi:ATP-dependent zinc metalloprotease FtsH [uncultured Campylobacter sp.]|uniref:ATP-dependent zinc metalloprotease FtsH n=1 Tax=uncultured Campylobacter sp. TaxID=218934 RepID=UPI00261B0297|nr:ATP-dependent zinc metalloprotease FtsH [uncultured Campylobacter sp.]